MNLDTHMRTWTHTFENLDCGSKFAKFHVVPSVDGRYRGRPSSAADVGSACPMRGDTQYLH